MSRSAMKQKRISRNSAIIDDALRHVGTTKKLYLSSHVCTIYRDNVSRLEPFSEQKAMTLMNKYYKKRQAHCTGKIFEDRFTLEKSKSKGVAPFRSWVAYKEIKHIYGHRNKPEYFTLCIDSSLSKGRYYEVYKCKTALDSKAFQDRIKQALADPDKIIRDPDAIRTESVNDDARTRSIANFEYQNDQPEVRESVVLPNDKRISSIYEIALERPISPKPVEQQRAVYAPRAPSPVIIQKPPSPVRIQKPPSPVRYQKPPSPVRIQKPPSPVFVQNNYSVKQANYSSVSTVNADPDGTKDIIYISYDSRRMAKASDIGPIYLYSLSTNQRYLPGRSEWGSTEHIDRNRLNAAPPTIDIGRTSSLPDFYVRPQEEIPVYTQPVTKKAPSPIVEYRQPVHQSQLYERPSEVIMVKSQPIQSAVYNPSPQLNYYTNNANNNNNNNKNNVYRDEEDELSDLTYISFVPNKGAVISDRGPVYMYRKNCRRSNESSAYSTLKPKAMNGYANSWGY